LCYLLSFEAPSISWLRPFFGHLREVALYLIRELTCYSVRPDAGKHEPHFGPLLVQARILARDAKPGGAPSRTLVEQPVLSKPIEQIGAVWNYACVVCYAVGGWLGLGLASRFQADRLGSMAPEGAAIGAIAGLLTVLLRIKKLPTFVRCSLHVVPLSAITLVAWQRRIQWFVGLQVSWCWCPSSTMVFGHLTVMRRGSSGPCCWRLRDGGLREPCGSLWKR
jgi:hypothetical protein